MRNKECHFPRRQLGKTAKDFELAARIERRRRLIKNQQLCVTQVGASQRNFLPFSSGKIYPLFEAPAQHLIIDPRQPANHAVRHALVGSGLQ